MAKILKSKLPYIGPRTENLIEFLRDELEKNSESDIIIDHASGNKWNGGEIASVVLNIAHYLVEDCGLKKGDVCSLYGEENDKFAILLLAVACAGGVSNYLTLNYSARELHDTTQILNCKFLISYKKLLQKIQSDLSDIGDKLQVLSYDFVCDGYKNGCKTIDGLFLKNKLKPHYSFDNLIRVTQINPDEDFVVIQFSTGTTGKPKPIPRTHKNLCHLAVSVEHEELIHLHKGSVIAGNLPLTHRPGIWALLACIRAGSSFIIWTTGNIEDCLAMIERYKVTILSSSIAFLSILGNSGIKLKEKYDTSSLDHVITSGAKIVSPHLPMRIVDSFELKSLRQCFGMTESGWVFLIEQSMAKDKYLSVGHVVPGMEAIIIDRESGNQLGPYERGEVALRGPQVFPGYLTNEKGVLNRGDFVEEGNWFKIGDQAYFDKNELIFIEGRYKEMFLFDSGWRFFPDEIEATIMEHDAIAGACVVKVGVRDAFDKARAYITLKEGFNVTEREVIEFVVERSPTVVLEGGVRILEKFPRLQSGKVDKQTLRTMP